VNLRPRARSLGLEPLPAQSVDGNCIRVNAPLGKAQGMEAYSARSVEDRDLDDLGAIIKSGRLRIDDQYVRPIE